jgi:hypothetical protein
MGHRIDAVVLKGPYDRKFAKVFDLTAIRLSEELTLFPLCAVYVDRWSEEFSLGPGGSPDFPLLNSEVVLRMVGYLAADPLYAIINTDYFGGNGEQAAMVYRDSEVVMPPEWGGGGPINKALRLLGVTAEKGKDEFDTVGLGGYRQFDDLFRKYWHVS